MDFFNKSTMPIVLALGFFDGAHLGHKEIFSLGKQMCTNGESFAVFTFNGTFFKNNLGNIFTLKEKQEIFKNNGASLIIKADWTQDFCNLTATEFLQILTKNHNIKGLVCGEDFTFGKNALGNVNTLIDFCNENNIKLKVAKIKNYNGKKISSSLIKEKLACGEVKSANIWLGENYFVSGRVVHGRGEGNKKTYPTANLQIPQDKFKIKSGVYATKVKINEQEFNGITNYGNCPTFNCNDFLIETYILNFNGDIYNKDIKIEFLDYLRDIKKFNSAQELKEQIEKDLGYFLW